MKFPTLFAMILALTVSMLFAQSDKPEIRTFTRESDAKTLDAFIVSHDGEKVKIQIAGNKQFTLDPTVFSEEDQLYITNWRLKDIGMPTLDELDERVKPGASFRVELPGLEETLQQSPGGFSIRIPEDYQYPDPVPILVFIHGGKGSDKIERAMNLVDTNKFVAAAFPFPASLDTKDTVANCDVKQIEALQQYHAAFLEELSRLIPNLHPTYRFVAGSSNGAHAIGSAIVMDCEPFLDFFHAYLLWEGGGSPAGTDYGKARDKSKLFWVGWGLNSKFMGYAKNKMKALEEAGAKVWGEGAPKTAHGVTPEAEELIKKWITDIALPELEEIDAKKEALER